MLFQTFNLEDIRREMQQWIRVALINDQSAYEQGKARKNLMEFSERVLTLAEALYVMNEKHQSAKQNNSGSLLPDQVIESIRKSNELKALSKLEKSNPEMVINAFCKTFSYVYCNCEIWDLLDAAVTNKNEYKVYKPNLVLFCQILLAFIRIANIFSNK
ncbi:MAG TPA: hypothetical protein VKI61_00245 [Chitinophagaceae bacterium]|nr:hypothetical protein [Chitinophagaceae bacterium]